MLIKKNFVNQPFFVLCMFEFFERFAYYGFIYISIFFYVTKLGISESMATTLMGGFSALTYAFNALGGYAADKILGIKRSMYLGATLLIAGYAILAMFSGLDHHILYFSLALIIIGSCLFKPAPTNLIASIYGENKQQLDITFTYFYMSINIGSFVASIMIPYLATNYGYLSALSACSIGLIIGMSYSILNYGSIRGIDNEVGKSNISLISMLKITLSIIIGTILVSIMLSHDMIVNWVLGIAAVSVFAYFIWQIKLNSSKEAKNKMIALLFMLIYAVAFFVIYQQKNTSFMLFNKHHVDLYFLGFNINPQTVPGLLNTIGIIFLSPFLARMYRFMGKRDLSLPYKFSLGLILSSLAYGLLWAVCLFSDPSGKVNFIWEVIAISVFFSSGELLVSALGLSLVSKLVPEHMRGFSMGMWFVTTALGIKLGSYVASLVANNSVGKTIVELTPQAQINSFYSYQHLFGSLFLCGMVLGIIAIICGKKLNLMIGK